MGSLRADTALERLQQGNERFRTGLAQGTGRDVERCKELAGAQQPFAVILCCADSRVVPEIAFDTGLGDLFVVRVAGNVANASSIGSIEYAVAELGTKLVVAMAHESCGAVAAVVNAATASADEAVAFPTNLGHLLEHLQPALAASESHELGTVARVNARLSGDRLIAESEIIREAVENDGVRIVSAFYRFDSGVVEFD